METQKKGEDLAKVLWYYNLIPDYNSETKKIVCPFHEDINPSLIVDFNEGRWFCFGCNCKGDAIKFVNLMENKLHNTRNELLNFKKFNQILNSKKCSDIKLEIASISSRKQNKELYYEAWDYYYGLRQTSWNEPTENEEKEAIEYMILRGFTPSVLTKCQAKVTYNKNYGIIFPMLDNGTFKGWVCRTMNPEIEKKRKYLYNKGFSRVTTLVGDYGKKFYVFIVEGYMDRLKFLQYGVSNVVAILGWKMSKEQIKSLKDKGITTIISALDNDDCGKRGTEYIKKYFKVIRFKYIKGIKDPGEMTKKQFRKCLEKTKLESDGVL